MDNYETLIQGSAPPGSKLIFENEIVPTNNWGAFEYIFVPSSSQHVQFFTVQFPDGKEESFLIDRKFLKAPRSIVEQSITEIEPPLSRESEFDMNWRVAIEGGSWGSVTSESEEEFAFLGTGALIVDYFINSSFFLTALMRTKILALSDEGKDLGLFDTGITANYRWMLKGFYGLGKGGFIKKSEVGLYAGAQSSTRTQKENLYAKGYALALVGLTLNHFLTNKLQAGGEFNFGIGNAIKYGIQGFLGYDFTKAFHLQIGYKANFMNSSQSDVNPNGETQEFREAYGHLYTTLRYSF